MVTAVDADTAATATATATATVVAVKAVVVQKKHNDFEQNSKRKTQPQGIQ